MRFHVLSFAFLGLFASVNFGQELTLGPVPADGVVAIYDPASGDLDFGSRGGPLTTFQVLSAGKLFTEVPNDDLLGLFDINSAEKIFKLEPSGFDSLSLPGVLPPGLSVTDIIGDLAVDGSYAAGGAVKDSPTVLLLIPEPTGSTLLAAAGIGFIGFRRRPARK